MNLSPLNQPRSHFELVEIVSSDSENLIMVFGGLQEENKTIVKSVETYRPSANKWTIETGFDELEHIAGYSVVSIHDSIYIIGGREFLK